MDPHHHGAPGTAAALLLAASFVVLAAVYGWSWRVSRHRGRAATSVGQLLNFLGGVAVLWVAVGSPLAHLDRGQLTAHMIQHLLIMTIAAPLLLLGDPGRVLVGALPERWSSKVTGSPGIRWLSPHPVLCWIAGTGVVLFWHVPGLFELGMRWHGLQHASFLLAGLLFWVPVVQPWPTLARWPGWAIPPYLFFAAMPCDALSAFLAFCGRVIYPRYDAFCGGISPLDDQVRAGALMWFWVTFRVPGARGHGDHPPPLLSGAPGFTGTHAGSVEFGRTLSPSGGESLVGLEDATNGRPCPAEVHPLRHVRELQGVAGFPGAHALEITEHHHGALSVRERSQGALDEPRGLFLQQQRLGRFHAPAVGPVEPRMIAVIIAVGRTGVFSLRG
jgi:cytochrome c oxidase assembly factor CtaG